MDEQGVSALLPDSKQVDHSRAVSKIAMGHKRCRHLLQQLYMWKGNSSLRADISEDRNGEKTNASIAPVLGLISWSL